MQGQAVVFSDIGQVSYQEVECPDPGPQDVVVRVTHSWISNGTEGSFLRGERIGGDTPRRDDDPWPFPIVAGYQKIGVVEWIGEGIADLSIGEVVFAATGGVQGMFRPRGGQVSPSVGPRAQIWKLPDRPEALAYAGLVLTQVGYNCGSRAPIDRGQAAIVIGDGLVGQWAAQTLAWHGVRVTMVGRHQDRLDRFGQGQVINAASSDWVDRLHESMGAQVQVLVDTVGSTVAVKSAMPLMQRGGHIVSAGFYGTDDLVALQPLRDQELSIDMVAGWTPSRMDATVELIRDGGLQTLPLITHRFPVSQAAQAWDLIFNKPEPVLGVILEWPR